MEKVSAILWDMNMTGFSKNREGLEVEKIGFDAIKVTGTHDRVKQFIDDTLYENHLEFKPLVKELGHEVWLDDFVGLGIIFDGYALEITNTSDTFAKEGYWIAHFYINGKWHYCALRSFATTWDESVKVFKELHEAGKNMIKDTTPPEYYNLLYMEKGV